MTCTDGLGYPLLDIDLHHASARSWYCHCPVRSNGEESYYVGNDRCAFGPAGYDESRRYFDGS